MIKLIAIIVGALLALSMHVYMGRLEIDGINHKRFGIFLIILSVLGIILIEMAK